jgi:hypothetical protein
MLPTPPITSQFARLPHVTRYGPRGAFPEVRAMILSIVRATVDKYADAYHTRERSSARKSN